MTSTCTATPTSTTPQQAAAQLQPTFDRVAAQYISQRLSDTRNDENTAKKEAKQS